MIRTLLFLFALSVHLPSFSNETYDDPQGLGVEDSPLAQADMTDSPGLYPWMKNDSSLNDYFQCHLKTEMGGNQRRADARLHEFNVKYKPHVNRAAMAFQVPPQLTSCLMFRETFFDNTAVSSANAQSIAQFTPATYGTLKKVIRETGALESDYKEYSEMGAITAMLDQSKSKNPFVKWTQFKTEFGQNYDWVKPKERNSSVGVSIKKLRNFEVNRPLLNDLREYLYLTSGQDQYRSQFFKGLKYGNYPSGSQLLPPSSMDRFIQNPMWIAGLNAYYLKQMMNTADYFFQAKGFKKGDDPLAYLLIFAGAYNQGPKNLYKMINQPGGSIKSWCQQLAKNEETKNYMLSIRRCMVKGSNFAPTRMAQNNQCNQHNGALNTTDPCIPIKANSPAKDAIGELLETIE